MVCALPARTRPSPFARGAPGTPARRPAWRDHERLDVQCASRVQGDGAHAVRLQQLDHAIKRRWNEYARRDASPCRPLRTCRIPACARRLRSSVRCSITAPVSGWRARSTPPSRMSTGAARAATFAVSASVVPPQMRASAAAAISRGCAPRSARPRPESPRRTAVSPRCARRTTVRVRLAQNREAVAQPKIIVVEARDGDRTCTSRARSPGLAPGCCRSSRSPIRPSP